MFSTLRNWLMDRGSSNPRQSKLRSEFEKDYELAHSSTYTPQGDEIYAEVRYTKDWKEEFRIFRNGKCIRRIRLDSYELRVAIKTAFAQIDLDEEIQYGKYDSLEDTFNMD